MRDEWVDRPSQAGAYEASTLSIWDRNLSKNVPKDGKYQEPHQCGEWSNSNGYSMKEQISTPRHLDFLDNL